MSRTYHHHAQRYIRSRYEVWSKRCRLVSMWTYSRFMKRVSKRWERRDAKRQVADALRDMPIALLCLALGAIGAEVRTW